MDQKERKFQSLGICNKVYIFLTRTLTRRALRTVNTNPNPHNGPAGSDQGVHPVVQETTCEGPAVEAEQQNNLKDLEPVGNAKGPEQESEQTKAIKKTVSINERVEEIDTRKKDIKRRKSRDQNLGANDEEPKPLRSILKVASNLDDNMISL